MEENSLVSLSGTFVTEIPSHFSLFESCQVLFPVLLFFFLMLKHVIIAALMQTLTGLVVLIPGACITNLTFFTDP